jgi:hypothetical protein
MAWLILRQMTRLERNVGALYARFAALFPQDSAFWAQLALEEERHAVLIETMKEYFMKSRDIMNRLTASGEDTILSVNAKVEKLLENTGAHVGDRHEALVIALQIEQSAGETHFQSAIEAGGGSPSLLVFEQTRRGRQGPCGADQRVSGKNRKMIIAINHCMPGSLCGG